MLLSIHTPCAGVLFSSWMSAPTSHLLLLDRVVGRVSQLSGGWKRQLWSLAHTQSGIFLYIFFHNCQFGCSPVRILFSAQYVMRGSTRGYLNAHSLSFEMQRSKIGQFSRSFVLVCVRLWNGLHESVFAWEGLGAFKTSVNLFLYKIDCPLPLPALQLFLFNLSFSGT